MLLRKLGEKVYAKQQAEASAADAAGGANAGASGGGEPKKKDEGDVVDAENQVKDKHRHPS
ncbi:hypothetical protein [Propionivibrio sp.]|uniref:hypothetical protein n=1 Tax=Propionivibrio sp. TaxID=2212460 RepID=UPI0025CFCE63|nr:hypothetical protein [Propionivibrio sp.]MBK8744562.1 hypothetical protein [Propionivibrio sp.]